jgi:hypothetical protein
LGAAGDQLVLTQDQLVLTHSRMCTSRVWLAWQAMLKLAKVAADTEIVKMFPEPLCEQLNKMPQSEAAEAAAGNVDDDGDNDVEMADIEEEAVLTEVTDEPA